MTGLWNDLRFAVRSLTRYPTFTAIAVVTLALGIGANTAVFTLVDGVLLSPLPFDDSDELIAIRHQGREGRDALPMSQGLYALYRDQAKSIEEIALFASTTVNLVTDGEPERIAVQAVTPGFFELLGIPLQNGRAFGPQDNEESFRVALVSREAATRFWPGEDVVGERFRVVRAEEEEWVQIIGIVGDVRSPRETEKGDPQIYVPFSQNPKSTMIALARTTGAAASAAPGLRQAVWAVDAQQPVDEVGSLNERLYQTQSGNYALIMLFGTFAFFALVMAAVGIYGVMSYSVSQRSAEISIRRALGAEANDVSQMVLAQGAKILVFGIGAGLLGAFGLSKLIAGLVVGTGISATDPLTFIGVPLILGAVALIANYVPARRATKIDPMQALRTE